MTTARTEPVWEPLKGYRELGDEEMLSRAREFRDLMKRRRTVREYRDRQVPADVIEACLATATTAPSGANLQPWHFVVITDADKKKRIRVAAEAEEREFYRRRAPQEWLDALAPLGTDEHKPFLKHATLIAIFAQRTGRLGDGRKVKHYYVQESVGIATGFLIVALHTAGLATLTHTPSPMAFLNDICGRPENEKPYILLVCGYPAENCVVPQSGGVRRPLVEAVTWL
ncbi:MAG: nitroreductase family protein [Proteobacteria bacterium]|nr:nitroreductase family protein [Pseudomonadota bacterium]